MSKALEFFSLIRLHNYGRDYLGLGGLHSSLLTVSAIKKFTLLNCLFMDLGSFGLR